MSYLLNKRWRLRHPEKRYWGKSRYYEKYRQNCFASGEPWTQKEIELITSRKKPPDSKLSKKIGRSVQAIQMMRNILKRGRWRNGKRKFRKRLK